MKKPFLSGQQLEEIAAQYPTPFYLYDEKGIRETVRQLQHAFSWNPGFREYFAVKATPTPAILEIMRSEGCGVDCSSYTELMLSNAVGFRGHEIMFSSNETPAQDYIYAEQLGAVINLDDLTHVAFLAQTAGIPKTICLRYNPGGEFRIGNSIMDNPGDAKYGMTYPQLEEAGRELLRLGAKHFGLHAFLVSNSASEEYYPLLAGILFDVAVRLSRAAGIEIGFINLSGGIGVPYLPDEEPVNIEEVGQGVKEQYEKILLPGGLENVKIFTELGRYMLAPHGILVTRALHEKHIYKEYIGVDACAANLMRPAMYKAYHHITVVGKEDAPHDHLYDVVGGLCENNDKFAVDRMLPEIERGDLLVIHDAGAHGHAMGYNYNGKLRCAEILLREDGSTELIRRAETPEDYFATLDFLHLFPEGEE